MNKAQDEYEALNTFMSLVLLSLLVLMISTGTYVIYHANKYELVCVDSGVVDEIVSVERGKYPKATYRLKDGRFATQRTGPVKDGWICVTYNKVEKRN